MPENKLRILSYNIHKGFSASNRHFILHQIKEALLETNADILFLQEMQGRHTEHEKNQPTWPTISPTEFLAQDTWPFFAYAKNAVYRIGDHGNAILSKYPLKSWENINVSPFVWASRSLLHAELELPWLVHDLHIICIHLGLTGTERRRQFATLCQRIDEHVSHDAPLIIAGDFNDWTGQAEKHLYQHLELKEAFRTLHHRYAKTFPSWLPVLRMDRIYYRGLQPTFCERLTHTPWNRLSDHAPLLATFER